MILATIYDLMALSSSTLAFFWRIYPKSCETRLSRELINLIMRDKYLEPKSFSSIASSVGLLKVGFEQPI